MSSECTRPDTPSPSSKPTPETSPDASRETAIHIQAVLPPTVTAHVYAPLGACTRIREIEKEIAAAFRTHMASAVFRTLADFDMTRLLLEGEQADVIRYHVFTCGKGKEMLPPPALREVLVRLAGPFPAVFSIYYVSGGELEIMRMSAGAGGRGGGDAYKGGGGDVIGGGDSGDEKQGGQGDGDEDGTAEDGTAEDDGVDNRGSRGGGNGGDNNENRGGHSHGGVGEGGDGGGKSGGGGGGSGNAGSLGHLSFSSTAYIKVGNTFKQRIGFSEVIRIQKDENDFFHVGVERFELMAASSATCLQRNSYHFTDFRIAIHPCSTKPRYVITLNTDPPCTSPLRPLETQTQTIERKSLLGTVLGLLPAGIPTAINASYERAEASMFPQRTETYVWEEGHGGRGWVYGVTKENIREQMFRLPTSEVPPTRPPSVSFKYLAPWPKALKVSTCCVWTIQDPRSSTTSLCQRIAHVGVASMPLDLTLYMTKGTLGDIGLDSGPTVLPTSGDLVNFGELVSEENGQKFAELAPEDERHLVQAKMGACATIPESWLEESDRGLIPKESLTQQLRKLLLRKKWF
ncbi:hypothetical protein Hypma_002230 [Hypsizygus marmoreus]|uniref:Uncharacterized protein n=1 Tax=Hypsizygus marmoreus TaxID=39966 RepID=A0A369JZY1_HYPMA|nr:hypothetical protein Hypma_002230 [Hypsizygus marmoreus]